MDRFNKIRTKILLPKIEFQIGKLEVMLVYMKPLNRLNSKLHPSKSLWKN
jgi:hypothetical protein